MAVPSDVTLPQPIWGTEAVNLKDVLMQYELPTVARVVKGQFMNIGTSKFNPLKKLHQDVLVHSIKTGLKVLGHSVTKVESRDRRTTRLVPLEQRLSIPVTYKGWFELLSEDGRSIKPIESVQELAKLFPKVNNVLVRQNLKAYLVNDTDGKMTFDKTKIVIAGEQLKVLGEVPLQLPAGMERKVRLLKCVDSKGENVFLSFDQRALFTPIAGGDDVMGVFMIKDVIHKFRLPLTVKLIQGVWPKVDSTRFTGLIRLDWAYTDETAFVCPLDRNTPRIYPIPTEVSLRLVTAVNNSELKDNEAYTNIMVKCNRLVANYHNTIHLIISVPEGAVKAKSHARANIYSDTNSKPAQPVKSASQMKRSRSREDILNDELDDLYGYLRVGKQPPVGKFTRDSDEETYYEEPEFEPMTKFRSRLDMLNKGDVTGSQKDTKYSFIDPRAALDANHNRLSMSPVNGHVTNPAPGTPPELPPRQYKRADSSPQISVIKTVSNGSPAGSASGVRVISAQTHVLNRRVSKENMSKDSKGSRSSGSDERRDSGSSKNRSSSKGLTSRKTSMPLLYL
ncbi:uncharacterized protein LOC123525136 [Mercenaria mercenaria]|uniref:uncharacterized protein LOC123525136 n=1 Tax=Mercenaria mercenaria TaxID=6596 RepID=UPI00234F6075|nr:uncharacterized protein LOC123525136 [Mercenaria mercenaria]